MNYVEALADFDPKTLGPDLPEGMNFLEFQQGDKIIVKQRFENGWWFGTLVKKTFGVFKVAEELELDIAGEKEEGLAYKKVKKSTEINVALI